MLNKRLAVSVAMIVLAVVAFTGWTYWTGTPSYALRQITAAVEQGDLAAFEARVAVDRVSETAIEALMGGVLREAAVDASSDDPFAALEVGVGIQMLEALREPAVELLSGRIRSAVSGSDPEDTDESGGNGPLSQLAAPVAVMAAHADVEGLAGIDSDGQQATAHVRIRHTDLDTTFVMDVAMEKEDRWRVVGLVDPVGYLDRVDATQKLRLTEINEPIAERLASVARVGDLRSELKTRPIMWGFDYERTLYVTIPVTNEAPNPLTAIHLSIANPDGGESMAFSFDRVKIEPGATLELRGRADYEAGNTLHRALREADNDEVAVVMRQVVELQPARPDTLALYPNWAAYMASMD